MIKVELRLQPEGKPQEVDGLLWGGKEPVQFQFDWGVPDELRHQNGTYVLHRSGTKCFPKSNPVEIIKIDRTSIGTADDLIGDHFDLLTATVLNRGNMLGDNLSLREVDKAKYRVIYANNEDLYLSGLERLATAVEPEKKETVIFQNAFTKVYLGKESGEPSATFHRAKAKALRCLYEQWEKEKEQWVSEETVCAAVKDSAIWDNSRRIKVWLIGWQKDKIKLSQEWVINKLLESSNDKELKVRLSTNFRYMTEN